jgi:hypothetical protein
VTIQLPSREDSDTDLEHGIDTDFEHELQHPEVLFEEARWRRRRRWMAGSAIAAAAVAGLLLFGTAGGGGGGAGATGRPHGSGPGATGSHLTASHLFPGAPATTGFYTGPGASCPLAHHNRYLPAWSGCVSTMLADVSGTGRDDLVITYSRLSHVGLKSPPRLRRFVKRYPAVQAMLRVVSPDGQIVTTPVRYPTPPANNIPARLQNADAAKLIAAAHISGEPGKQMVLQTGQISSGSNALVYSLYRGRLISSGVVLAYGGDGGSQAGFQCVKGNPPRLVQRDYELIRGIRSSGASVHIYGRWKISTTTYAWRGPRLVKLTEDNVKRRLVPNDTAGAGCMKGVA